MNKRFYNHGPGNLEQTVKKRNYLKAVSIIGNNNGSLNKILRMNIAV